MDLFCCRYPVVFVFDMWNIYSIRLGGDVAVECFGSLRYLIKDIKGDSAFSTFNYWLWCPFDVPLVLGHSEVKAKHGNDSVADCCCCKQLWICFQLLPWKLTWHWFGKSPCLIIFIHGCVFPLSCSFSWAYTFHPLEIFPDRASASISRNWWNPWSFTHGNINGRPFSNIAKRLRNYVVQYIRFFKGDVSHFPFQNFLGSVLFKVFWFPLFNFKSLWVVSLFVFIYTLEV